MKNVINYYYNIVVNDYVKHKNSFIFSIENNKFEFLEFYGSVNELQKIYYILNIYNKECDKIIYNNENKMITYYNRKPYLLLQKYNNSDSFNIEKIISYSTLIQSNEKIKWKELWKEKQDYYELQFSEISQRSKIIKKSYCYYYALNEIAISILNYADYNNIELFVSHRRITTKEDLYNPLNIIFDSRVRDIAEYIKNSFFFGKIDMVRIENIINKKILKKDEIIILLARLIYPSYYFDIFEKIYIDSKNEIELNKIIKKNINYEELIKKIYYKIKKMYNIPIIEFLEY